MDEDEYPVYLRVDDNEPHVYLCIKMSTLIIYGWILAHY